jgi:uncharacterized membrane protein
LIETKIFVATYFSTSIYQALRMDIPIILIFNEKCMPAITAGSNIHGLIYEK